MVIHYIILSSSYSTHSRIALHKPYLERIDYSEVGPIISSIEGCFGGATVQIGVHIMQTRSDDWNSVVEEDPYFQGVKVIGTMDEFIRLIKEDEFLKGVDVAGYILKTVPCTQTRVNELTYMCYADYLCNTGRRMFTDDIFAFTYGSVVETVWNNLRSNGHPGDAITCDEEPDDSKPIDIRPSRLSMRSRILFAANGAEMLYSIDATLKKYEKHSTGALVDLTHREMTPWSMTDRSHKYSKITDELITKYHHNESI